MTLSRAVRRSNQIKNSRTDTIFLGAVYTFLAFFVLVVLYPLIYVVSCSFSSPEALVAGRVFILPVEPGLQGYKAVFNNSQMWSGYFNSFLYTSAGTVLGVTVTIIGGYVISRREFPFRGMLTAILTITMFFNGGTMPTYLLVKQLGLIDSIGAIILPGAINVWLAIVARTFIQSTVPEELFEAVSLDGGGYFDHLFRIVLPLCKAVLAVLALNFATGHWNSYFSAMIYLNTPSKFPLQIVLRNILISNIVDFSSMTGSDATSLMERQYLSELMKYSLIIISSLPLLVMYPFIQKYFIKGVMIGSIKG